MSIGHATTIACQSHNSWQLNQIFAMDVIKLSVSWFEILDHAEQDVVSSTG